MAFIIRLVGTIIAACLVFLPAALAQVSLRPIDQAASQPDFFTFRAHLQAAVARRDIPAILAVVHKDIKNSFGGDNGIEEFKKKWELEKENSPCGASCL